MRAENLKKIIDSYNCLLKEYKKLISIVEKLKVLDLSHNKLKGLQGGGINEYYHLTKEQLDIFENLPTDIQGLQDSIANLTNHTISDIQGRISTIEGQIIDLQSEILNKVDKELGKGLSEHNFSENYKNILDNLQIPDISGKLDRGDYVGTAKNLKDEIDTKVDKVPGKTLTTNDYSNEEKNKVINLEKKVVKSISITGDVNKRLTLTFEDGSSLTTDFIDKDTITPLQGPDIKLNSMEFDINTGIFTGVRSDGQRLTVNINGRFALLNHNHNDLYNTKQEITNFLRGKVDTTDPRLSDSRNAKDVSSWAKQPEKPTYNFTEITNLVQEFAKYVQEAPKDSKDYIRNNGVWKAFEGWTFKELNTENLNNVKAPGFYGKVNSSEVTAERNYPNSNVRGGHLLVLPMTLGSNLTIFQVYFSAGTKNSGDYTNSARIFMRAFVNNLEWLPWREFDGGKVHNVTENSLNLANAYKGFPVDNSVFVLNQATTISVPNSVLRCRFIKNTSGDITFSKVSGVTIIGNETISLPEGTEISLVCNGNRAYINTGSGESVSINHDIGTWD